MAANGTMQENLIMIFFQKCKKRYEMHVQSHKKQMSRSLVSSSSVRRRVRARRRKMRRRRRRRRRRRGRRRRSAI